MLNDLSVPWSMTRSVSCSVSPSAPLVDDPFGRFGSFGRPSEQGSPLVEQGATSLVASIAYIATPSEVAYSS
jgi:hypothetical protein